jgi:hypothetical protein
MHRRADEYGPFLGKDSKPEGTDKNNGRENCENLKMYLNFSFSPSDHHHWSNQKPFHISKIVLCQQKGFVVL